jgi:hypothetical protein
MTQYIYELMFVHYVRSIFPEVIDFSVIEELQGSEFIISVPTKFPPVSAISDILESPEASG